MATTTSNYGFKKPEGNDFYSIEDQNRNWDLADSTIANVNSNLAEITPKLLTALGVFTGTISRNASSIFGKLVNVSLTIAAPASGIANDTTFFYINKKLRPVVAPILLGTHKTGYIYSSTNAANDTIFAARVEGGIPANVEIFINFSCFIDG